MGDGSIVVVAPSERAYYDLCGLHTVAAGEPVRVVASLECVLDVVSIDGEYFTIMRRDACPANRDERRQYRLEAVYA